MATAEMWRLKLLRSSRKVWKRDVIPGYSHARGSVQGSAIATENQLGDDHARNCYPHAAVLGDGTDGVESVVSEGRRRTRAGMVMKAAE